MIIIKSLSEIILVIKPLKHYSIYDSIKCLIILRDNKIFKVSTALTIILIWAAHCTMRSLWDPLKMVYIFQNSSVLCPNLK